MKKFIYLILSALLLVGCVQESDAFRFKKEYESLNGKENDKGRDYVNVVIPEENPMVYANLDTVLKVIESEGIIYFGFDECPWCRNALPVLIEAATEKEVEKIYYYDIKDIRDTLILNEDGTITTEKEKSEDYQKIYDALYDSLNEYEGLEDETIKRLYAPTVFFIKHGKVVGMHESTVESQVDSSIPMTDAQKLELKSIYSKGIDEVNKEVCDLKC